MTLLDDYTMTQIRADQTSALPSTCTIMSPVQTVNDTGTRTTVHSGTVAADVACRMRPQAIPKEQQTSEQLAAPATYILSMAYDGTLDPSYQIIYDGGTYAVTGVIDTGSWTGVIRATCTKVEPA